MRSISLVNRVWIGSAFRSSFSEGQHGVSWVRKRTEGAEVRMDDGNAYLIPWSNITIAQV